ncbi:PfkB family carbohydrate kinase [Demequina aestuarii]|uniref:PfkB family carbohydrate kinase n=1 Tax=Demequina aestuarii TaxID=327095 RepID=UPI0007808A57|nr:PfkB family carbohydrate kinase [Demequina aestuarii]
MTASAARALFVGLCTLDIIQSVDRVPGANEKVVARESLLAAGGPATNAAVAFAHHGGAATLLTRLPDHPLSEVIRDDLGTCGVTLSEARAASGAPVTASIMVTRGTGERAVVSPTSRASALDDAPMAIPSLEGVGALLVDGYHPATAIAAAKAARASDIPVLMDAGSVKPHTADVAREVDMVIASADVATPEGSTEPADVVAWFVSLGVESTVITRGARDVHWRTPGATGTVEIVPMDVVDTLGAGDFFHGALVWRVATLGLPDARLAEDIAWAARAVAPSLASFGTRAWLRT